MLRNMKIIFIESSTFLFPSKGEILKLEKIYICVVKKILNISELPHRFDIMPQACHTTLRQANDIIRMLTFIC